MEVIAKCTMFIDKGTTYEKEMFTEGESYRYWVEASIYNHRQVTPKCGNPVFFNEEEFYKYFSIKE